MNSKTTEYYQGEIQTGMQEIWKELENAYVPVRTTNAHLRLRKKEIVTINLIIFKKT